MAVGITGIDAQIRPMWLIAHQPAHRVGVTVGNIARDRQVMVFLLAQPPQRIGRDQTCTAKGVSKSVRTWLRTFPGIAFSTITPPCSSKVAATVSGLDERRAILGIVFFAQLFETLLHDIEHVVYLGVCDDQRG